MPVEQKSTPAQQEPTTPPAPTRRRPWLARSLTAGRWTVHIIVYLGFALALFFLFALPPIARNLIVGQMESLGFVQPGVDVSSTSPWRTNLANLADASDRITIDNIAVTYDPPTLAASQRVQRIDITGLQWTIHVRNGRIDLGLPDFSAAAAPTTTATPGELPFSRIILRHSSVILDYEGIPIRLPVAGQLHNRGNARIGVDLTAELPALALAVTGQIDTRTGDADLHITPATITTRPAPNAATPRTAAPQLDGAMRILARIVDIELRADLTRTHGRAAAQWRAAIRTAPIKATFLGQNIQAVGFEADCSGRMHGDGQTLFELDADLQCEQLTIGDISLHHARASMHASAQLDANTLTIDLRDDAAASTQYLTLGSPVVHPPASQPPTTAPAAHDSPAMRFPIRIGPINLGVERDEDDRPPHVTISRGSDDRIAITGAFALQTTAPAEFASTALRAAVDRIALSAAFASTPPDQPTNAPFTWQGTLHLDNANLRLPAQKLTLAGLNMHLPFASHQAPNPGAVTARSLTRGNTTYPGFTAAASIVGRNLTWSGQWPLLPNTAARFDGRLNLAAPWDGRITAETPRFEIDDPQTLHKLIPELSDVEIDGEFQADAQLDFSLNRFQPRITLDLHDAAVRNRRYKLGLLGVSGRITIDSLHPLSTPGGQRLRIESARLGRAELSQGDVAFRLEPTGSVLVERMQWTWQPLRAADADPLARLTPPDNSADSADDNAGPTQTGDQPTASGDADPAQTPARAAGAIGQVYVHAFRYHPGQSTIRAEVFFEDFDLAHFIDNVSEGAVTGRAPVTGRLPIAYAADQQRIRLGAGYLYGNPGRYPVHIREKQVMAMIMAQVRSVFRNAPNADVIADRVENALRNFEYEFLAVRFSHPRGDAKMPVDCRFELRGAGGDGPMRQEFSGIVIDFPEVEKWINAALLVPLNLDDRIDRSLDRLFDDLEPQQPPADSN